MDEIRHLLPKSTTSNHFYQSYFLIKSILPISFIIHGVPSVKSCTLCLPLEIKCIFYRQKSFYEIFFRTMMRGNWNSNLALCLSEYWKRNFLYHNVPYLLSKKHFHKEDVDKEKKKKKTILIWWVTSVWKATTRARWW